MNLNAKCARVPTYNKLQKLPLGSVTAAGWLRDQLLRNKDGMGGHLDELEPDMIGTPFLNYAHFREHPLMGKVDESFASGWSGEISGTYWTGLVELAFTLSDAELIGKATRWVDGVLLHQEPDGYLGSYPGGTDRNADYNPWASMWCYRALLSFYEATGRQDVLDAVYRGCLWFCEHWHDHKTDYAGATIIEPMTVTFAYTGDERLLQFCKDWLDWLEENSIWPNTVSSFLSDSLPYTSIHAVAYGEAVKHPAIVYGVTGDKRMLAASRNGLEKALCRIVQTTGGVSSCSEFLSPKGGANETEYCNFSTFQNSYFWMSMMTGEASWGDEIERAFFNGAQGARKKDERAIAYFTSPNQLHANRESSVYGDWGEYGVYAPCFHVGCCNVHSVEMIPEYIRGAVMTDTSGDLYLLCYGPMDVHSEKADLSAETLYPFREIVTLRIHRAESAKIHLRIPAWCKAPSVTVNGTPAVLTRSDSGFASIDAPLNTGDVVTVRFPMEVTLTKVDDSDAASKFPIAIERGPLVYALPVKEKWTAYPGRPITPLPEGWSWFEAVPELDMDGKDVFTANYTAPWMKAIDESLDPARIRVIEHEPNGYVWENPPITLEVPLYRARYAYMFLSPRQNEPWEVPLAVEGEAQYTSLVPHGCTNLRITYLPRAKV